MKENETTPETPRVFISYSWSSPEHQEWVIGLAKELAENGVHVVFDKWDLKENDDKYQFMEQAVVNPDITKVIMICDKTYKEKADNREGGVGTETQIISAEVYEKVISEEEKRQKFCAVIAEVDERGKPYLPAYLKSRIYIDMSTEELRERNFEQLLRWVFDKPLEKRPQLGAPPSHLFAEDKLSLRTSSIARHATSAVRNSKPVSLGLVRDYLDALSTNLGELELSPKDGELFDDQVMASIELFLPYRNEFLDLVETICRYSKDVELIGELGSFFERITTYLFPANNLGSYYDYYSNSRGDHSRDNFRFIVYELFLFTVAILLKNHKFDWITLLLTKHYLTDKPLFDGTDERLHSYLILHQPLGFTEVRARRLEIKESIIGTLLKERSKALNIDLVDVMQADLILYLRDELLNLRGRWFPYSLVYSNYQTLELFKRSESKIFFGAFKSVLGIETKEELGALFEAFDRGEREILRFSMFHKLELRELTNYELLATKT